MGISWTQIGAAWGAILSSYLGIRTLRRDRAWIVLRLDHEIEQNARSGKVIGIKTGVLIWNAGHRPCHIVMVGLLVDGGLNVPPSWFGPNGETPDFVLQEGEYRKLPLAESDIPAGGRIMPVARDAVNHWWPWWRQWRTRLAGWRYRRQIGMRRNRPLSRDRVQDWLSQEDSEKGER